MKRLFLALVALLTSFGDLRASAAIVTSLADDGPGSLREAIALGGDMDFAVTGTITLTSGELVINNAVNITGPGADQLTIARSSTSGTPEFRVVTVNGNATISGVTLGNGLIGMADGYENGGGVLVKGSLTLRNCAVTGNRSVGGWTRGTGIYVSGGGRLTAVNCLFARNSGQGFDSEGSAIYNYGALALTNCTFSGNSAGYSAAIQNDAFSDGIVIDSCTIFDNTARFAPALMNGVNGAILLRNSIVAGNSAWDGDWEIESRGHITSAGYNLIGFVYHGPGMDPVPPHPTDHTNLPGSAVRLAPLANNGGPTHTHALLTNSPAFDAGPATSFPATDQRGVARPQFSGCDIGAFEAELFLAPTTNHPPLANPQTVTAQIGTPLPITLTGSDPDGDPLTYSITTLPVWGTLSGTPPNVIYTAATNSPDWDLFAFKVNDGKADSASAGVNVVVLPTELPTTNQPPTAGIVSPASGTAFTAPANVVLIASVHDPDGIAAAATVEFFEGSHKLGDGQLFDPGPPHEAPFRFIWTNVPPGEYTLTAKVTDDHGAMAVSDPVHISVLGGPLPDLSFRLAFNNPNRTDGVFFQDYTLTGAVSGTLLLPADRVLADGGGRYYYGAKPHQMWRVDSQTSAVQQMDPGSSLPELSWPMGVAFDNQRNRVLLTSLGGEGFLYAYSPPSNQWSLVRSMDDRDLDCLEYHASQDALFGVRVEWGGGPAAIYRFSADGAFLGEIPLPDLPFGIGPGGYWSELVSVGDYLVLLLEADPVYDPYGESRIYLIDPRNGDARLTYQNVRPRPNLPPTVQINSPANGEWFSAPAQIQLVAYAQDPEDGYNLTVEFFEGTNSIGLGTFVPSLCPAPYCPNFALTWSNVPPGQYTLTAKARDSAGAVAVSSPVRITVYDPALSIVTLRATDASASEAGNTNTGTFTVYRDGNTNDALNVFYSISGTASNGVDFVALSNSVDLPAGIRTATILVMPIDDDQYEGSERVELHLVPPPVSPPPYIIISPSNAVVTISDNEPPPPRPVVTIQATDPLASETAGDPGQFTVYRTGPTTQSLYVFCAFSGTASNGADCVHLTNTVVIPAGSESAAITVTPIDDNLVEGTESVVARLYYPFIPDPRVFYIIGSPSNAVVTIDDNDGPATNIASQVRITFPTNGATFTSPANIQICAAASDYVATVEFLADNTRLDVLTNYCHPPTCVHVMAPLYCVVWSNVPPGLYTLTAKATDIYGASSVSAPIHISVRPPPDPYQPVVTIEATDAHASEPGVLTVIDPGVFTVHRSGNTSATLHVQYRIEGTASNGLDYAVVSNIVVIPAGVMSARIEINPLPDALLEVPEAVTLRLQEPVCIAIYPPPPDCYRVGAPGVATVYIADGDGPTNVTPVVTITASDPVASEGTNCYHWPGWPTTSGYRTNTATFTVRRTGVTDSSLTVFYNIGGTASNGVDYAALLGAVVIPAGQRSTLITVMPVDDDLRERIDTMVLDLYLPPSASPLPPPYIIGNPNRAAAIIVDHDLPRPLTGTLPDGRFHIMRPETNGAWFRIECSTNLLHWMPLCTNSVTDGAIHFVDPDADALPSRFYRVVLEPKMPAD